MVGSELRRRDATATAVGANLVVVAVPVGDDLAGLGERGESMFVEAFVAELDVETLDVAVLRRAARFSQDVLDAMLLRPGDECVTSELRPVVGTHGAVIAA